MSRKRKHRKGPKVEPAVKDVAANAPVEIDEIDAAVAAGDGDLPAIDTVVAGAGDDGEIPAIDAVAAGAGEDGDTPATGDDSDAPAIDTVVAGAADDGDVPAIGDPGDVVASAACDVADGELVAADVSDGVLDDGVAAIDDAANGETATSGGDDSAEVGAGVAAELPTSASAMDALQLKYLIEALIFASDKPVTLARLRQLTRVSEMRRIEQALESLAEDYRDRGLVLQQISGGYQFRTRTQWALWVQQLIAGRPVRLSRAQLETLAIIAYRQPITRPEIDDIRGVDSSQTLKLLLDRALIRMLGKKEEVGRPILYGTTKEFLDFFSLGDLRELPTLREYSELTDESRRRMGELGIEPPTPEGAVRDDHDASIAADDAADAAAADSPEVDAADDAVDAADDAAHAFDDAAHPFDDAAQASDDAVQASGDAANGHDDDAADDAVHAADDAVHAVDAVDAVDAADDAVDAADDAVHAADDAVHTADAADAADDAVHAADDAVHGAEDVVHVAHDAANGHDDAPNASHPIGAVDAAANGIANHDHPVVDHEQLVGDDDMDDIVEHEQLAGDDDMEGHIAIAEGVAPGTVDYSGGEGFAVASMNAEEGFTAGSVDLDAIAEASVAEASAAEASAEREEVAPIATGAAPHPTDDDSPHDPSSEA